jgi:hypothetical protein
MASKYEVLLEVIDKTTYNSEQVIHSEGLYTVFYDNKPVNIRNLNILSGASAKYKRSSFLIKGHAVNLAKKLNTKFKTDKFSVVLLTAGSQVYP